MKHGGVMLDQVRRRLSEFSTRFDPARLTARDAARVVEDASAIEKMAATVKALAAARVAETGVWKDGGDRSAAHQLARATGTSVGQAKDAIETGRRLRELPATAEAARRGELSLQQASAVADAATADPDAEPRLLRQAKSGSLGELRDEVARTKANASDLEARRRRIHERRSLRNWVDGGGVGHLHLTDNPEKIADIVTSLAPTRDRLFEEARKAGRREPLEAYAADALHRVVCGERTNEATANGRTKMLVRIDFDALLRGHPIGDETCEIAGYGPVAVSVLREMLETGDPFLAAIVTRGKNIVGVAHLGRRPTARQQSALEWLYPTCAVEGCNALAFLQNDHRKNWAKTKKTVFDLLDRLCPHHHELKTTEGWQLVAGTGKRAFVPPGDPRHPERAHAPPAAA